jgi:hypothetical protein
MITTDMRLYNYYTLGEVDEYGMPQTSSTPKGQIKMAINISSQATQDSILYKDCTYIGLTQDAKVNDTYIIESEEEGKLKVLYVNNKGRYKQVFLKGME